jgi:hypothetical protein
MRTASILDFAFLGKLREPESECRNEEALKAQQGPSCAQHSEQGPTESKEGPDPAGQTSKTRDERTSAKAKP